MDYIYGTFSDAQIKENAKLMHNEIHKLLLYKDGNISDKIFNSECEFETYFIKLLYRYGGLNKLIKEPKEMVAFMSTLQSAFEECLKSDFNFNTYRTLILDAHGYLKIMFGEVR